LRTLAKLWVSEGLVECITEVYENTLPEDDCPRMAVGRTVTQHHQELLSKRAFQYLLHQGGDLAIDLTQILPIEEVISIRI
jgi:hypothetical protein